MRLWIAYAWASIQCSSALIIFATLVLWPPPRERKARFCDYIIAKFKTVRVHALPRRIGASIDRCIRSK